MYLKHVIGIIIIIQSFYLAHAQVFAEDDDDEETIFVDVNQNVTLPCVKHKSNDDSIYWRHLGQHRLGEKVSPNGALTLVNVTRQKHGHYICINESDDAVVRKIHLIIRGPPDPPSNVTVRASTVLAVVSWHLGLEPDYEENIYAPKTSIYLRYRSVEEEDNWQTLPTPIGPQQHQADIYQLTPNTTYEFQLWTRNIYGESEEVSVLATTNQQTTDIELEQQIQDCCLGEGNGAVAAAAWRGAVVVVSVLAVLTAALAALYHRHHNLCASPLDDADCEDSERIELVPHIIENPGYQVASNRPDSVEESSVSSGPSMVIDPALV